MDVDTNVYMIDIAAGTMVALSMLPERIECKTATSFQSYDVLGIGEAKIPKGAKLTEFSWSGILPGEARQVMSYVKKMHWRNPREIQETWSSWREYGTRIQLMVTGTPINHTVYLSDYTMTYEKGSGDYQYSISFILEKNLVVYTYNELNMQPKAVANQVEQSRPKPPVETYTVKSGDSLWKIAQSQLGSGARYMEIYNLNTDKIKNKDLIYPGQVLTLPS